MTAAVPLALTIRKDTACPAQWAAEVVHAARLYVLAIEAKADCDAGARPVARLVLAAYREDYKLKARRVERLVTPGPPRYSLAAKWLAMALD